MDRIVPWQELTQALSVQERSCNRAKSKIRSRVEHVFHVLKCRFGFTKVRYRGLEKNANHHVCGNGAGQSGDCEAAIIAGMTGVVCLQHEKSFLGRTMRNDKPVE